MKINNRVTLSYHVKAYHCTDVICQTDDIIVKQEHQSEKCKPMCQYNCFYCGYMINSQEDLQRHKTECCEADSVISDLKCCDTRNRQTYSFPLTLPPVPILSYTTPLSLPVQAMCYTCKEFQDRSELRRHYESFHPDYTFFWCNICLASYGSQGGLQTHMRNQHDVLS